MKCIITIRPHVQWEGGKSVILNKLSVSTHKPDREVANYGLQYPLA